MRATLTSAAIFSMAAALAPFHATQAADTPNAAQIIDQLTPTDSAAMTTRGIRLGGQAPAGQSPAAPVSTGAMKPRAAEANLSVPFASGSAAISPAATRVLDQLGEALASPKLAAFKFRVEGHTDTTGQADTNKTLSEQRATAVTDYLATKFNIDRARMTPVGMGEEGLLVDTGPGVANASNRRVLVVNMGG